MSERLPNSPSPTATPKVGEDGESVKKGLDDKHQSDPQKKEKRGGFFKRLKKDQWVEFGTIAVVVFWPWADFVGCHDILRLWFLAFTLLIAHGTLCYFVSKLFLSLRFGIVVWLVLAAGVGTILYYNSLPQETFSVSFFGWFTVGGRAENMIPQWWFVHPIVRRGMPAVGPMNIASPVYAMASVRIINNKEIPERIDAYSIEVKIKGDGWHKVATCDTRYGSLYCVAVTNIGKSPSEGVFPDFSRCQKWSFYKLLEDALMDRTIEPKETIDGWVFLDSPPRGGWESLGDPKNTNISDVRFCTRENDNSPIETQRVHFRMMPQTDMDVQLHEGGGIIKTGDAWEDLGNLQTQYYSDGAVVPRY